MSELRGTTRERGLPDDIDIDDIVIEDIHSEDLMPVDEFSHIAVDEGPAEVMTDDILLEFVEEPSSRTEKPGADADEDMVDLEALTAEIDTIDRVDLSAFEGKTGSDSLAGSERSDPRHDDHEVMLNDFESIDEINLDDIIIDAPSPPRERVNRDAIPLDAEETEDVAVDMAGAATAVADDIPYDLIDDDFIIIEEETGAETSSSVRFEDAAAFTETDSLDDALVRIHDDLDGSSPGSIIDENRDDAHVEVAAEAPGPPETVIETVSAPAPPEKKKRRSDELTIQIPEKVKKILPGNFKISDIRPIDLLEAEKIAGEDILVLTQDDLIEELDSIDLVPLDEDEDTDTLEIHDDFEEEDLLDGSGEPLEDFGENIDLRDEARKVDDGNGVKNGRIETLLNEDELLPFDGEGVPEVGGDVIDGGSFDGEAGELALPVTVDEEEVILTEPLEIVDESDFPRKAVSDDIEAVETKPILLDAAEHEDETITIDESVLVEMPHEEPVKPEPSASVSGERRIPGVVSDERITLMDEPPAAVTSSFRETIPSDLSAIDMRKNAFIIDDGFVTSEATAVETIFERDDLERITSGMVEVIEGESRLLREATTEEDRERIAAIMSGSALAFEDLLIDFEDEYKFIDEDTGYIDSVFISEEFIAHEKAADGTAVEKKRRKATRALEIFGLSENEISEIESGVFAGEYREIDLSAIDSAASPGLDQPREDYELQGKYLYLGDASERLTRSEKASIEEDLSGGYAVVFEEDSGDIRNILANYRNKKKRAGGDVYDISGDIVLLEEKSDVDRFVESMPAEKRQNIKSLLKYLDGLFEKLPEEAIRKFAQSEYYNLYVQVLNELDR